MAFNALLNAFISIILYVKPSVQNGKAQFQILLAKFA